MTTIRHPQHAVPTEIAETILSYQREELTTLELRHKIDALSRPTEEERRELLEINMSGGEVRGLEVERQIRITELRKRRSDRVVEVLTSHLGINPSHIGADPSLRYFGSKFLGPVDTAPPPPVDHTFWWAETSSFIPAHVWAEFRDDGLHFTGGPTHHNGNLFNTSFGANAVFELQAERIPHSATGRWISTPFVELFGGLLGYTGNSDVATGDLWSKCWMHRRQTVLQMGLGPTGPAPIILGNAEEHQVLIFEENADRTVHAGMPGLRLMPPVFLNKINMTSSLFAHLEIRFDIQLEGAGTLIWADPEILLRTVQWPLNAL